MIFLSLTSLYLGLLVAKWDFKWGLSTWFGLFIALLLINAHYAPKKSFNLFKKRKKGDKNANDSDLNEEFTDIVLL